MTSFPFFSYSSPVSAGKKCLSLFFSCCSPPFSLATPQNSLKCSFPAFQPPALLINSLSFVCRAVSTLALEGTLLEQRLELSPSTNRGPNPRNDAGSKRFTQIGLVTTQKSELTELFSLFIIFLVVFWQRNPERATKSEVPLPEVEQKCWNLSGLLELSQAPPKKLLTCAAAAAPSICPSSFQQIRDSS